jgi:hypothetical protein
LTIHLLEIKGGLRLYDGVPGLYSDVPAPLREAMGLVRLVIPAPSGNRMSQPQLRHHQKGMVLIDGPPPLWCPGRERLLYCVVSRFNRGATPYPSPEWLGNSIGGRGMRMASAVIRGGGVGDWW